MGTDYSAMESVLRKLEGVPIKPKGLYKELETGCLRAVPDNDLAAKEFEKFFSLSKEERFAIGENTRQLFEKHYQWDDTGRKWEDYFDSVEISPWSSTWESPARIQHSAPKPESIPDNANPKDLARWLVTEVLREPDRSNSFLEARLTRDLMYNATTSTTGGMYFNESSQAFDGQNTRSPFNFDIAYDHMSSLCNRRNMWEQKRMEAMNK